MSFFSKIKNRLLGEKDEAKVLKELIQTLESQKEKIQFQLSENIRQVRNSLSELEDKIAREKELEDKARDFLSKNDESSAIIAIKKLKMTTDCIEQLHINVAELDNEKLILKKAFIEVEEKIVEINLLIKSLANEKNRSLGQDKIAQLISNSEIALNSQRIIDEASVECKRMETLAKGKLKAEMAIASIESTYNPELEDFVKDKLESLKRS